MLTVSRSVDRVFQIIELFAARRRPLSATEIHQALNLPHSSAVSVLSRLTGLGYLEQNSETKRFFPSLRLRRLCETVPDSIVCGNPLAELTDRIQYCTDETTSISRLDGLFTMPIYVRLASHASAWRVIPGIPGGLATHSVAGRALLSTLTAAELQKFIERANHWASRTAQGAVVDVPEITRATEFVREHGYLCRYNLSIPGIGAISAPLPDRGEGERLVVTVAGAVDRIQQRGRKIIQALMQEVNLLERTYYRRMQREPILRQAAVGITATVMTSAVAACE
jgi:DNA-binding IclR family transcriptional regulator